MPDLDLIKQEEQGAWDRRGRFPKRRSGNPARQDRRGMPEFRTSAPGLSNRRGLVRE